MHLGQVITFVYDNCEYLGKVLSLKKKTVRLWVLGADVDFMMRYGRAIELNRALIKKG